MVGKHLNLCQNFNFQHIDEVIVPYLKGERQRLNLEVTQHALLIIDVFRGQMTDPVLDALKEKNILLILLVRVPANMTHLYQPLDLMLMAQQKHFLGASLLSGSQGNLQLIWITVKIWKA